MWCNEFGGTKQAGTKPRYQGASRRSQRALESTPRRSSPSGRTVAVSMSIQSAAHILTDQGTRPASARVALAALEGTPGMTDTPPLPREPRKSRRGLPPFSVLIGNLRVDLSRLIRGEIGLLKAELSEKFSQLGVGVGLLVAAAVFAFFIFAALLTAAVVALSLVVAPWLAALIVAAVLLLVAGILVLIGSRALKSALPPVPEKSIRSLRDDVAALKGPGE
jgi:hypothetical protein